MNNLLEIWCNLDTKQNWPHPYDEGHRMKYFGGFIYLLDKRLIFIKNVYNGFSWIMSSSTVWSYFIVVAVHDGVIKWKHIPRYWPFVRGIQRWPMNSPHKGQRRGAFGIFFDLRINGLVNNREAGDLRRHCAHYDVIVMDIIQSTILISLHRLGCTLHSSRYYHIQQTEC